LKTVSKRRKDQEKGRLGRLEERMVRKEESEEGYRFLFPRRSRFLAKQFLLYTKRKGCREEGKEKGK
jgi:hypothetical protein